MKPTAVAVAAAVLAAAGTAPAGQDANDDLTLEIRFDAEPVEKGLRFERKATRPTTVTVDGRTVQAWEAFRSVTPKMGWMKSFRITVTDERFRDGRRPACDLEIVYRLDTWGGVTVYADTTRGSTKVGSGWGGSGKWQTLRVRLDDAFFGARDHGSKPDSLRSDGYDIRIYGVNVPLQLRSVRLTGYRMTGDVDWSRLLKVPAVEADPVIYAFRRKPAGEFRYALWNISRKDQPFAWRFRVADRDGRTRHRKAGRIDLPAETTTKLEMAFDPTDWPYGVYDASLELTPAGADEAVFADELTFAVVSDGRLGKAGEGEYLFGLDAGFHPLADEALRWYDLMGVDILRDMAGPWTPQTPEAIDKALATLEARGVTAMLLCDPPKDRDAKRRKAKLKEVCAFLEATARRLAGRLKYFELGNEPDLPFFYPGPIEEYVESYQAMYGAIKRGNPETVVMNGGLCFFGPEGRRRARRFVQLVDPNCVDAWGYHGHGPGAGAERNALERMRRTAREFGKGGRPCIETESGVAAHSPAQEVVQARTCVQKTVYAQSEGLPTLMWFRLFMEGNGDYTNVIDRKQPRPVVPAYRAMVQRLRGRRFSRKLDLGAEATEAYLFSTPDGREKALVAWATRPARIGVNVRLDAADAAVDGAAVFDLYGNRTPARVMAGNIAGIEVAPDPTYLVWSGPGEPAGVDVAPPILAAPAEPVVLAGAESTLTVAARNPSDKPLAATLAATAFCRLPVEVRPSEAKLNLPAGGRTPATLGLRVGPADGPLRLPRRWRVFTRVDRSKLTDEHFAATPESLPAPSGTTAGRDVFADAGTIDFAALAGGFDEKAAAVAYATIDCRRAASLPAGAGADWWMQWFVNGRAVYDTLEGGNKGPQTPDAHTFDLPLRKGANTVAVLVLSGSAGWKLVYGGPGELAVARSGGISPDRLELALRAGGTLLARQSLPLALRGPLPPRAALPARPTLAHWLLREPAIVLDERHVTNFHDKHPDRSRRWQGPGDLWAMAWLRDGADGVRLVVAVRDDAHRPAPSADADGMVEHDALEVRLADAAGKPAAAWTVAYGAEKPLVAGDEPRPAVAIRRLDHPRLGPTCVYRLTLPPAATGTGAFALHLTVRDNDLGYPKQLLRAAAANAPLTWQRFVRHAVAP